MGTVIQDAFKELAENPYRYHSEEEWKSGLMKLNSQCPTCLLIKEDMIFQITNPKSPEAV